MFDSQKKVCDGREEEKEKEKKRGYKVWVLREIQRQFPWIVPSATQGHTVYDLTAHCISPSTFVVLFGADQESPNWTQNMVVGWQPKTEPKTAKCLWSSSQVNPGQVNPARSIQHWRLTLASVMTVAQERNFSFWPRPLVCATPLDTAAMLLYWCNTRITANWLWRGTAALSFRSSNVMLWERGE